MKPVKAIDAVFLQLESAETPMHVGALFVLDPGTPQARGTFFRRFRAGIGRCLGASEVFTRRVAALPLDIANPWWITSDPNLDYHVRRTTLPRPGTRRQLEECVADLHEPLMDRHRPLWELHVIEGLADGRIALYVKTHHAGLDGATAQAFLRTFATTGSRPRRAVAPPKPSPEHVTTGDLLLAGARHQAGELMRAPRALFRLANRSAGEAGDDLRAAGDALAGLLRHGTSSAPRTPLNVTIGAGRSFASVEVPLERMRRIARAHGATLNDVVLAAGAGALRRWLLRRDALPAATLRAAVPFSTREAGDDEQTIRVSFLAIDLHTGMADPHARLQAIHDSAVTAKATSGTASALMPADLPSVGLPWLLGALARALASETLLARLPLPANVVVSNVAGPPVPLYVAGARALTYAPVSIPYHGCALNVTVYSYAGRLFFGLTGARSVLPDLRDLETGLVAELVALGGPPSARGRPRRSRSARPRRGARP